ncbi:MAG: hypothetical protein AAGB93_01910 [Planctomycetota bacterium]
MGTATRFAAIVALTALSWACVSSSSNPAPAAPSDPGANLEDLLDRADDAFDSRAYDEAADRYRAIHLAAKSGALPEVATEAAAQVATIEALREQMAESDSWMQAAEAGANADAIDAWSRVLLARGVRSWKRSDLNTARGTFIELHSFCAIHDRTIRQIQAANLVALVSVGQEQLDWSLRAIQAAQTTGEAKWEAPLWSSHAWLLDDRDRLDDALRAFARARTLTAEADVTPLGRLQTDWSYAHGLRRVGRAEEAREILERANSIAHSIYIARPSARAAEHLGRILWELAEVDVAEGKTERARERYAAARSKLVEAGAQQAAPELLVDLDRRVHELDHPVDPDWIPPRKKKSP